MGVASNAMLEEALEEAKKTIAEQGEIIEQLQKGPWPFATVLENRGKTIMIATKDGVLEVEITKKNKNLNAGDTIRLNGFGAVLEKVNDVIYGHLTTVIKMHGDDKILCNVGGLGERLVLRGNLTDLEEGDQIALDSHGVIARAKIKSATTAFAFHGETGVTWDDIIGQEHAKKTLRTAIEGPMMHVDVYKRWSRKPMRGIALEGPPGNGKTLLAKAAATAIKALYKGHAARTGFIYVKGPEILDKYVGEAEARVRSLFAQARKHKAAHGYPSVLFIDEADAILRKRGTGRSSDVDTTVVPAFLAEMDGLDDQSALVLLATNQLDKLDPAVMREGRIDRKLTLGQPDEATAAAMLCHYMKKLPCRDDRAEMATNAARVLFNEEKLKISGDKHLSSEISGAMINGITERATDIAIEREIGGDAELGLTWPDISQAIVNVWEEHVTINTSASNNRWNQPHAHA